MVRKIDLIDAEIVQCHCSVAILQSTFPTSSNWQTFPKQRTNCPTPTPATRAAALGRGRATISTRTAPPLPVRRVPGTTPSHRPAPSPCTGRSATPVPNVCCSTTTHTRHGRVRACGRGGRSVASSDPMRCPKPAQRRPSPSAAGKLCIDSRPVPGDPFARVARTCSRPSVCAATCRCPLAESLRPATLRL
ncbi:hypothetical protein T11_14757 [Trichinella zimbabwensis]|uniref:Uncharacterized protein n=1 Tax=Trichinella zimbabwensis TaxID=268475 RepID=A0A0V1H760_9BILA|nr:hypothetical protein T11_14757 [Trichinella zimbabwensis]